MNKIFRLVGVIALFIVGLYALQYFASDKTAGMNSKEVPRKVLYYRDPMGGPGTSPVPAKDGMGMDFIPVYEDEVAGAGTTSVADRSTINLSPARQQLIGVSKASVTRETVQYEIRASGRVAFDPELYAAINDYEVAREAFERTAKSVESIRSDSQALLESAKLKLRIKGFSDEELQALTAGKVQSDSFLLRGENGGKAWVYADVFEYELPQLKIGQRVVAESPLYSSENFTGEIVSISPVINPETRTVGIKAQVADPKRLFKPDMFLSVKIQVDLGPQLTIPDSAVIHTGDADIVFRVSPNGDFAPQAIVLGPRVKGNLIVRSGLIEGDTVVAAANFLVDSESRLRSVVAPQVK